MKKHIRIGIILYILADYLSTLIGWTAFFFYRKIYLEHFNIGDYNHFIGDQQFVRGIIIIPVCWVLLYYLLGFYTTIYRKSRLSEVAKTFLVTASGVLILFFTVLIDDRVENYSAFYKSVAALLLGQFLLTALFRMIVLNYAKRNILSGKVGFKTLILGGNKRAVDIYLELSKNHSLGYQFVGFIDTNGNSTNGLSEYISKLGKVDSIQEVIKNYEVEEVIVAIETSEHPRLSTVINQLLIHNVIIKLIPDTYDIIAGSVKMNHLLGAVFIEIYPQLTSQWQYNLKRLMDVFVSVFVLVFLSPVYLICAIGVKLTSKGKIFYKQERIGLYGKSFTIYKFRSMCENAEKEGPLLSRQNDFRITSFGRIMRKWRLDELPQFVNVLWGEMSLVGPRPERQFFIDRIISKAPDYIHVQRAKPGITSWGMVKFGYAQNVDEMIVRMKYDLLYIENMSLMLDLKILLYTIRTILQGRGK